MISTSMQKRFRKTFSHKFLLVMNFIFASDCKRSESLFQLRTINPFLKFEKNFFNYAIITPLVSTSNIERRNKIETNDWRTVARGISEIFRIEGTSASGIGIADSRKRSNAVNDWRRNGTIQSVFHWKDETSSHQDHDLPAMRSNW